jgi:hypothetical protein
VSKNEFFVNHSKPFSVTVAARLKLTGAIVATGLGQCVNFGKFPEQAQLNSFAGTDVRHNPNVIFSKRCVFRFLSLFGNYPRLTFTA